MIHFRLILTFLFSALALAAFGLAIAQDASEPIDPVSSLIMTYPMRAERPDYPEDICYVQGYPSFGPTYEIHRDWAEIDYFRVNPDNPTEAQYVARRYEWSVDQHAWFVTVEAFQRSRLSSSCTG